MRQFIESRSRRQRRRIGACVAWILCLGLVGAPAWASSVKSRVQAERLLLQILPCAGTLAANVDQANGGGTFSHYMLLMGPRALSAANGAGSIADIDHAAEMVMGMIAMDAETIGSVDVFGQSARFDKPFMDAIALHMKDRKSPAGTARVSECIAMAQRLAPAFDAAHMAAIKFGLNPAGTRPAAPLIDASESDRRSAAGRAKDDAKRNAGEFASKRGYVVSCRVAEDDDFYATRPHPPEAATLPSAALDRERMQALAAAGQTVFAPCTYAGTERSRYQAVLGRGAAGFLPIRPAERVSLKVHGLATADVVGCDSSRQKSPEIGGVITTTTTTNCHDEGQHDFDEYVELKGIGEVVLLAVPDAAPPRAAQRQRMHCALYVRDLDYVARQLPVFLANAGGWRSLQDYFAQQSLWKAENYAKTSGNASLLQQRANATQLIGQGSATKNWARKIADEVFFPAPHLGQKQAPPAATGVPDSITGILAQVLGTGPAIMRDIADPNVQTIACQPRKKSLAERYVRLLQTKKEEKDVSDKVWGGNERGGSYGFEGPKDAGLLHCYRFDDAVDPLACAPYYPQLWAVAEDLPTAKDMPVDGEDIY